jgi:hypothetical protein
MEIVNLPPQSSTVSNVNDFFNGFGNNFDDEHEDENNFDENFDLYIQIPK